LVAVRAEDRSEAEEVVITNQELTDSIICSNVVTKIRNKDALVLLINLTEEAVKLQVPSLEHLVYEQYHETSVSAVKSQQGPNPQADGNQIALLTDAIRTTHLNSEDKAFLENVCHEYWTI